MIRQFVGMSHARSLFGRRIEFTVYVPSSAAAVEHLKREPDLDQSLTAALGTWLPVTEAVGSMVIDIDGGTTEVDVVLLGGTVYQPAIRGSAAGPVRRGHHQPRAWPLQRHARRA